MVDVNNEHLQKIAQMRAEHRKQVADLKKKRFAKMLTNIIVLVVFLTAAGVGMSSIGYTKIFGFLVIALLPAISATISDKRPGRFASKTVTAFNLSGMSPYLASIFYSGSPNQTAISIMSDGGTWMLVYGFSIFGWVLVFIIPYITEMYLEVKAAYSIKRMVQFQRDLVDEWGDEIKK